jgi:hypothetical protein
MQLPRGTFREIRKNETAGSILQELERTKFSGICSISSGPGKGTLVFGKGRCILAKFLGKQGDTGWDELQNILGVEVDAALSTLDEAQIQLSLEFNKTCRIVKAGKIGHQHRAPAPLPRREHAGTVRHEPEKSLPVSHFTAPAAPVKTVPVPAVPQEVPPLPEEKQLPATSPASPSSPSRKKSAPEAGPAHSIPDEGHPAPDPGASSFDMDIATLDSMDMENVTDKIRNDCKTMIKQLHLEHLMER